MLGGHGAGWGPAGRGGEPGETGACQHPPPGPSLVVSRCCLFQEPECRQDQMSRTSPAQPPAPPPRRPGVLPQQVPGRGLPSTSLAQCSAEMLPAAHPSWVKGVFHWGSSWPLAQTTLQGAGPQHPSRHPVDTILPCLQQCFRTRGAKELSLELELKHVSGRKAVFPRKKSSFTTTPRH